MALSVPQKDLQKAKKPSSENILPFTAAFNLNNSNTYSTIKSSVNCSKNNNVCSFHDINLIQSKHQLLNLKKLKQNIQKFYEVRLTVVTKSVNAATVS